MTNIRVTNDSTTPVARVYAKTWYYGLISTEFTDCLNGKTFPVGDLPAYEVPKEQVSLATGIQYEYNPLIPAQDVEIIV